MTDNDDIIFRLHLLGCQVATCGSRVTCNPPPTETDRDYLVLIGTSGLTAGGVMTKISEVVAALHGAGFRWEGDEHYQKAADEGFMSWRKDDMNLIVTANLDFAEKHHVATALCKRLNLMNKQDRIALFQAVLYGVEYPKPGDAELVVEPPQPPAVEKEITF